MTPPVKIRVAVYASAVAFLLWPILVLTMAWTQPRSGGGFILCAVILIFFLAIGRWDIVAYGLQYVFLVVSLLLGYRKGWLSLALSLAFWVAVELLFRRAGRAVSLDLSFPLRRGTYCVAHGGNLKLLNHHRQSKPQRHALDIVRLNGFGTHAAGIYPKRLGQYKIFGDVVCSPGAGLVTHVENELPDLSPGEMDRTNVAGNHIIIRCDDSEVYVGLAHLMQGSVLVKAGDRVTTGQILARVGNSGNTSEPHLHIHAKRGSMPESILDGEGVPMRFDGRWLIRNSVLRRRPVRA